MSERAAGRCRRGVAIVTLDGSVQTFTWKDPGTLNAGNQAGTLVTQIELDWVPNRVTVTRVTDGGTPGATPPVTVTRQGGTLDGPASDTSVYLVEGIVDFQ